MPLQLFEPTGAQPGKKEVVASTATRQFLRTPNQLNRQFTDLREDLNRRFGDVDRRAVVGALVGTYYR
jgi:hypothetical protein